MTDNNQNHKNLGQTDCNNQDLTTSEPGSKTLKHENNYQNNNTRSANSSLSLSIARSQHNSHNRPGQFIKNSEEEGTKNRRSELGRQKNTAGEVVVVNNKHDYGYSNASHVKQKHVNDASDCNIGNSISLLDQRMEQKRLHSSSKKEDVQREAITISGAVLKKNSREASRQKSRSKSPVIKIIEEERHKRSVKKAMREIEKKKLNYSVSGCIKPVNQIEKTDANAINKGFHQSKKTPKKAKDSGDKFIEKSKKISPKGKMTSTKKTTLIKNLSKENIKSSSTKKLSKKETVNQKDQSLSGSKMKPNKDSLIEFALSALSEQNESSKNKLNTDDNDSKSSKTENFKYTQSSYHPRNVQRYMVKEDQFGKGISESNLIEVSPNLGRSSKD